MGTTIEELNIILSARIDGYQFALASAQRETDQRLSAIESRVGVMTGRLKNSVSSLALGFGGMLSGITAAFSVQAIGEYADAWTRVTRSLAGTSDIFGISLKNGEEVARMAIETRSNLETLEKLYSRTAVAASKLGFSTQVAADVTTTFAKALKLGSANTAEQASVMVQFSQALQKGKLDGDEFRAIMENAGVVQQALTEKFKVSGATLMQMAHEGKITAKDIIAALQQIKPKIDEVFARTAATVSEAWENLKTALTVYIGKANQAKGVTETLGAALQGVADNIDTIGKSLAVLGTVLAVAFGPALISTIGSMAAGLVAAATGGGLLMGAILGLVAAVAAADQFGDKLTLVGETGVTVKDVLGGITKELRDAIAPAIQWVVEEWQQLADGVLDLLMLDGPEALEAFKAGFKSVMNATIGGFIAMANGVGAVLVGVFGELPEELMNQLNEALRSLEWFVREAAKLANKLPGVSIDVDAIKIGEIPNLFAGAADKSQAYWKAASEAMGRDYIGEMGAAADQVVARIKKTAEQLADERLFERMVPFPEPPRSKPTVYGDPLPKGLIDAIRKAKEHTEVLLAEARAVGLGTAEKERAQLVQELLNKAKEKDVKITPELIAQMDEVARAYGRARANLELLQAIQGKKEETEALRRELQLTGLYGEELYRARVEMELLAKAKAAGLALTPELQKEINKTAAASAAMQSLRDQIDAVRDTARSALSSFVSDLRAGKIGAEALANSLNKIADKLIDMAVSGLVEKALGGLFNGSGAGGGGLLSIFGFAGGGVMTPAGPRALNRFAGGGVSRTAAIFGEAGPEAAVPLPDGRRIPVELRLPNINAASQQVGAAANGPASVTVAPVFNLSGSVSPEDLARVKAEVVQVIPRLAAGAVNDAMKRRPGFGQRGV